MQKIYGRKPVLEAILSGKEIEQIYVAFGQRGEVIDKIFAEAKKLGIKVSQASLQKFQASSSNPTTQGVYAIAAENRYYEVEDLINSSKEKKNPLIVMLDSIQDTHNLGAILRSAACAGVDGVITTINNSAPINETVEKTSAGAVSHLKIAKVSNLVNAIEKLKKSGFWVVGSTLGKDSKDYRTVDYKSPIALIMGNEEKGIRRLVAENCDHLIRIDMPGNFDSLNVSVATGVILFEILGNRTR
ncbi:MAG: 23S rRNA (guanosine(2251)-2'-O)-methyltransferase RlmB [Melioribacteraceae bacterium]|nr:23S rRNA (guanosine(2251)-2'-O)-methyltransferase RlmB [Melioribacteraceae bacterium]